MGLFGGLFSAHAAPQRQPRRTTDQEINAVLVPLRDRLCDFNDNTGMGWVLILPAVQRIAIRLFIQVRGREATQRLLESQILGMAEERGIGPQTACQNVLDPGGHPDQLAQLPNLEALLWRVATERIAKGSTVEHVAQAFSTFVLLVAARILPGQLGNTNICPAEHYAAGLIYASQEP
jgi:hypothetical protein